MIIRDQEPHKVEEDKVQSLWDGLGIVGLFTVGLLFWCAVVPGLIRWLCEVVVK